MINDQIARKFGGKVRIRAVGLCWKDGQLLMVNHSGLGEGSFWSPPGGGVDFGVDMPHTLAKEFEEETGLIIEVGDFKFACEFVQLPLHAVELFFEVNHQSGNLRKGWDPELEQKQQIITEVRYMNGDEIYGLEPNERHGIFNRISSLKSLENLTGFHRI